MDEKWGQISAAHDLIYERYNPHAATFITRDWLESEVADFCAREDARQLIIIGEPGSGKTGFMASLADAWNCPRHFIRAGHTEGAASLDPKAFLVSVGAQLYEKYGPDIFPKAGQRSTEVRVGVAAGDAEVVGRIIDELYTIPFLPQSERTVDVEAVVAAGRSKIVGERVKRIDNVIHSLQASTLLHVMLLDPVAKIRALYPEETVVLLIDALDETQSQLGETVLDAIPRLEDADYPPNLRLVMSSRPGPHLVRLRGAETLDLDDEEQGYHQQSLADMRHYIDRRLGEKPIATTIAAWPDEKRTNYIQKIEASDDHNFLYLYHFFNEIEAQLEIDPNFDITTIQIPSGLDEIYRYFAVKKIKADIGLEEWLTYYLPVLGVLAVLREPVDRTLLAAYADVDPTVVDYIRGQIRQFLDINPGTEPERFKFYHLSFSDYLLDSKRNRDYPLDGARYHDRIVSQIKGAIDRWSEIDWAQHTDDYYIFPHLAAHLMSSGRGDEVRQLFDNDRWMHARFEQSDYTYVGFIADIMLAWQQIAHEKALSQIEAGEEVTALAECLRYALIRTSINSLGDTYVPKLIVRAVELGKWPTERACEIASRMQIEELIHTYRLLVEKAMIDVSEVKRVANNYASGLLSTDLINRIFDLAYIAEYLEEKTLEKLYYLILQIDDSRRRLAGLKAIALYLPDGFVQEIFDEALKAGPINKIDKANLLKALAPRLTRTQLERAIEETDDELVKSVQIKLLTVLYQQLDKIQREKRLHKELDRIKRVHPSIAAEAIVEWREYLEGNLADEALEIITTFSPSGRIEPLRSLVEHLSYQQINTVTKMITELRHVGDQAPLWYLIAHRLADDAKIDALQFAIDGLENIYDIRDRSYFASEIAIQLDDERRTKFLRREFEAIGTDNDAPYVSQALVNLAPALNGDLLEDALAKALALDRDFDRAYVIEALAPRLYGDLLEKALIGLLEIESETARMTVGRTQRTKALDAVGPYLPSRLLELAMADIMKIHDTFQQLAAVGNLYRASEGISEDDIDSWRETVIGSFSDDMDRRIAEGYFRGSRTTVAVDISLLRSLANYFPSTEESEWRDQIGYAIQRHDTTAVLRLIIQLLEQQNESEHRGLLERAFEVIFPRIHISRLGDSPNLEFVAGILTDDWTDLAFEIILDLEDENYFAEGMAAFAHKLSEEQMYAALKHASQFSDKSAQAVTISGFLSAGVDVDDLRKAFQALLGAYLQDVKDMSRGEVLEFLSIKRLFGAQLIPVSTTTEILHHTLEILLDWNWT